MADERARQRADAFLEAERSAGGRLREDSGPFRILVLADFAGRGSRPGAAAPPLESRPALRVDRDTFEAVLRRVAPEVHVTLSSNGQGAAVRVAELDDFLPGRLNERQEFFRLFREEWQRAAQLVRPGGGIPATTPPPAASEDRPRMSSDILEAMLDEAETLGPEGDPLAYDLNDFLKRSLRRHAAEVPKPSLDEQTRERQIEALTHEKLRVLLHDPAFRRVEALWRALDFLLRNVPDDVAVHVHLLDLTREELVRDLGEGGSALAARLGDAGEADARWSLAVGGYEFDAGPDDLRALEALAAVAARAHVPWVSAAAPAVVGASGFAGTAEAREWAAPDAAWERLRAGDDARWLGLVAPRLLSRLPYGRDLADAELPRFEELPGGMEHESFVWANGAFAVALILARAAAAAAEEGEPMRPERFLDIDGVPMHVYRDRDGELASVPPGEGLLTEHAAVRMLERGVMPLLSFKDSPRVRLARVQSIAGPRAPLAGRWSEA